MDKRLRLEEQFIVESKIAPQNHGVKLTESAEGQQTMSVLIPKIEAIHAGITKNKVLYPAQALAGDVNLKSGVYSWTYPYPKPVLKNHDTDVEPLGRVTNAQFITDSVTGKNAILVMPHITDPDAIQKIMDGRYLTVSIGAETDSAVCNICGTDVVNEGLCEHVRGQKYEVGKEEVECVWEAGNLWFHEVSFVNVPADQYAQVVASGEVMTMECFASDGKDVYNLQAASGTKDYLMTKESAIVEGIITSGNINNIADKLKESNKGGTGALKTLEEYVADLAAKETELQEATDKLADATNQLTEKDTQVAQLVEEKAKLEADNQSLTEAQTQLQAEVTTLTEKSQELETKFNTAQAEADRLLSENAEMATQLHKTLVERVVDLKCGLRKPGSEDKEAMVAEHTERSDESLNDTLADLLKEMERVPGRFIPQPVTNPGLTAEDKQDGAVTLNEEEDPEKAEQLTAADIFYGLLGSKRK